MKKIILGVLILGVLGVAGAGLWLRNLISGSLPEPGRGARIPGLKAKVEVLQDSKGVPTIRGQHALDIYAAQGWVVARDRLFQLDLTRRRSAGRLAEILGDELVELDIRHRQLGIPQVVRKVAATLQEPFRSEIEAFSRGVNAFIEQGPLPFEMKVLGYEPEAWTIEDSMYVVFAIYDDLDYAFQPRMERALTKLYELRPDEVAEFLTPDRGYLDVPIIPDRDRWETEIPGPDVFQLKESVESANYRADRAVHGSNAFVVSGKRTRSGLPILAGDPHMTMSAPNIWYRMRLEGDGLSITGLSLPGIPGLVIGSNGNVAWSFTNVLGDTIDFIRVKPGGEPNTYLTPNGIKSFRLREETIKVKGEEDEQILIKETIWGPIVEEMDEDGELEQADAEIDGDKEDSEEVREYRAVQWTALDPEPLSKINLSAINRAKTARSFLRAAENWHGPVLNLIFATRDGDIGWKIVGVLPERVGFQGDLAIHRREDTYWKGYRPIRSLPSRVNPSSGYLVSGNQRCCPVGPGEKYMGTNYPSPSRAKRMVDLVSSKKDWTAEGILGVQLDSYTHTGNLYRDVLLDLLQASKNSTNQTIVDLVKGWDGKAEAHSAAYRFLHEFAQHLNHLLLDPLWASDELEEDGFNPRTKWYYHEPVIAALFREQPKHLLNPDFQSYSDLVQAAVDAAVDEIGESRITTETWGDVNRPRYLHPFAYGVPWIIGKWISMPDVPLSGDYDAPRVARSRFAATMRMVVDLSDPKKSIFQHAGGQSGHFQSPHYRDQFRGWARGDVAAFQPGSTIVKDTLLPLTP